MSVRKGAAWGRRAPVPADALAAPDDAALAALVTPALEADELPPAVILTGGDLHRTLGGVAGRAATRGDALHVEVDVLEVTVDGVRRWAVAHVVAQGRAGWSGPSYVAMNAAFAGPLRLGPRAHPGDGLADVTEGRVPRRDRREARRRMESGSHLPHDGLRSRRVAIDHVVLPRPLSVHLDGVGVGRATQIDLRVLPDALTVLI